jgi:hypothetical protein
MEAGLTFEEVAEDRAVAAAADPAPSPAVAAA